MRLFDSRGMMIFPNPMSKEKICKSEQILVVKECYCQNGHSLINDCAVFNGFPGIVFKIRRDNIEGLVALSPVYGYKSRVSMDIKLKKGEVWNILCPECGVKLPVFSKCSCGSSLIALFANKNADFFNCIVVCNRIDCFNAAINHGNEMITLSMIDRL